MKRLSQMLLVRDSLHRRSITMTTVEKEGCLLEHF